MAAAKSSGNRCPLEEPVSILDMCHLTSDQHCNLLSLIGLYKDSEGDPEMLGAIQNEVNEPSCY